MTQEKYYPLKEQLKNHTGTSGYHKFTMFGGLKGTDGFVDLLQKAEAFWLGDIIESVQHLPKVRRNRHFIIWRIKQRPKDMAVVEGFTDLGGTIKEKDTRIYKQIIHYTDFPFDKIGKSYEFYQEGDVVLLKSEH